MPRDEHLEFNTALDLTNRLLHTQIIDINNNGFAIKKINNQIIHFKFYSEESGDFLFTNFFNDVEDLMIDDIDVKDFYYEKDDDNIIDICQIIFFNNCKQKILKIIAFSASNSVGLIDDDNNEQIILASCVF